MRETLRFLICFVMLAVQMASSAENKQKSYEAARQQASEAADILSAGPLQIRATFHLHVLAGQLDGTYRYSQLSKDEYREEVQTPGFSESVVYKKGERYFVRSKELEPLPIWYLRELIYFAHMIPANAPVSRVTTSVQNGQNVKCYLLERGPFASEFSGYGACFDVDTGILVSMEWTFNSEIHRFEYSKFLHEDRKLFPGTMRRVHNGNLLAEVNVDSISHAPMEVKLLDPPANASKQGVCRPFSDSLQNLVKRAEDRSTSYYLLTFRPEAITTDLKWKN